jgi:hypothetical protein
MWSSFVNPTLLPTYIRYTFQQDLTVNCSFCFLFSVKDTGELQKYHIVVITAG